MQTPVSLTIRPHLVSFLYEELEGETQAVYGGKKVKLAKISCTSLIGQLIEAFKVSGQITTKSKVKSYSVFLTIQENGDQKGMFHEKTLEIHRALELLPEHVTIINNLLESIFRLSLVQFIKGYTTNNKDYNRVNQAVEQFMIKHNLWDFEIDPVSLTRLYYRSLKKKSLTRLQNQVSEHSYNFAL